MSFSSGSTAQAPQEKPNTLGLDESDYSTNQQARPLPYAAGKIIFALTWISDVFNVSSEPVVQKIGKKATTVGYTYFASFAGVGAHGPFTGLHEIRFDNEVVWSGDMTATSDGEDVTIEGRGTATIYWGTETQTADADLVSGTGDQHPPYLGQFAIVFKDINLGQNRTQVPNVQVVASRYPNPSWMSSGDTIDEDANIIACVAEWLQNPRYGLLLPDARLDTTALGALAAQLGDEGIGISPYIDRTQTARQLIVEALQYCDGFITFPASGKISFELVRPETAPATLFSEANIVGEPSLQVDAWSETFNETSIEYVNRDRRYQEDASNWRDPGNFQITGEPLAQRLSMSWCTRQAMADQIAATVGRIAGIPAQTGSISVFDSELDGLQPGGRFLFTWAEWGFANVICRCLKLQYGDPDNPVDQIAWEVDRSELNDDAYLPPEVTVPTAPTFDPVANADEILFEVPSGWDLVPDERLLLFAARGNGIVTGFNAHHRLPSLTYNFENSHDRFVVHGALDEDYPATTDLIDDAVGLLVTLDDTDLEFENRDLEDALTNDVLLFVGEEIIAIFGATLVSGNQWRIYGIRERYDTDRLAHATDDEVWIVERSQAQIAASHPEDPTQTWKLQPFSINREVDLGDVTALTIDTDHRGLRPWRPSNLAEGGDLSGAEWSTGEDLDLTWDTTLENRPLPFWSYWDGGLTESLPSTVLEFHTAGMVLKQTVTLDPGVESYAYANAAIVTDFGSEQTVIVRAYQARGAYRSTLYRQLTVTFV